MDSQTMVWMLVGGFFAVVAMETKHISMFVIAMFVCLISVHRISNGYVLIAMVFMIRYYTVIRPYHRPLFFIPDGDTKC